MMSPPPNDVITRNAIIKNRPAIHHAIVFRKGQPRYGDPEATGALPGACAHVRFPLT